MNRYIVCIVACINLVQIKYRFLFFYLLHTFIYMFPVTYFSGSVQVGGRHSALKRLKVQGYVLHKLTYMFLSVLVNSCFKNSPKDFVKKTSQVCTHQIQLLYLCAQEIISKAKTLMYTLLMKLKLLRIF